MTKHDVSFEALGAGGVTRWLASCGGHAKFVMDTYEAAEDEWRKHVHFETGSCPRPTGSKQNRWEPVEVVG